MSLGSYAQVRITVTGTTAVERYPARVPALMARSVDRYDQGRGQFLPRGPCSLRPPPSISPTTGSVGTMFTATDGTVNNGTVASRRWLLGGWRS